MAQKIYKTTYPDGSVVISNLRRKKGIPVLPQNGTYTATKVTTWYDGSPMTLAKADGLIYLREKSTGDFYRVDLPNWGEAFLEKDTVAQMRGLSPVEILLLKSGYYKGITLNGYYEKGDTPASIQYYLYNGSDVDDGGSVFEVRGIKVKHDFNRNIEPLYFGVKYGEYDSTICWSKLLTYASLNYGCEIFINGLIVADGFEMPDATFIRGFSVSVSKLKLINNTDKNCFIDCRNAAYGGITDLFIDGNKSNQTKEVHGVLLNGAGGKSNYNFHLTKNYFRFFSGDGIKSLYLSWIFTVSDNRIRDCDGYGINNESTDNGFFNNNIAVCKKGGFRNTGTNTRIIGGKIIFNGWENENSSGFYNSAGRCTIIGVECQENFYHGFYFENMQFCTIQGLVSDMNNVARRPTNTIVPDAANSSAVGYGLKIVNCSNNIIDIAITSSTPKGDEKFTQYGKFIGSNCNGNILNISQQEMFGSDSITPVVPLRNNFRLNNPLVSSLVVSTDGDYTIPNNISNLILTSNLTQDRKINLPDPTTALRSDTILINNRSSLANSFNWVIDNFSVLTSTTTLTSFIIPKGCTVTLQRVSHNVSIWKIVNLEFDVFFSNTNDNWDSQTSYPSKKAVSEFIGSIRSNIINVSSGITLTNPDIGKDGSIYLNNISSSNISVVLPPASQKGIKVVVYNRSTGTLTLNGRTVNGIKDKINDSDLGYTIPAGNGGEIVSDGTGNWYSFK